MRLNSERFIKSGGTAKRLCRRFALLNCFSAQSEFPSSSDFPYAEAVSINRASSDFKLFFVVNFKGKVFIPLPLDFVLESFTFSLFQL